MNFFKKIKFLVKTWLIAISRDQKLSEDFIREFKNKINIKVQINYEFGVLK